MTDVKFSLSCCWVKGVFQAPQAACGWSITHHRLPEDAFNIPTGSVVISPASARYGRYLHKLNGQRKNSRGLSVYIYGEISTKASKKSIAAEMFYIPPTKHILEQLRCGDKMPGMLKYRYRGFVYTYVQFTRFRIYTS